MLILFLILWNLWAIFAAIFVIVHFVHQTKSNWDIPAEKLKGIQQCRRCKNSAMSISGNEFIKCRITGEYCSSRFGYSFGTIGNRKNKCEDFEEGVTAFQLIWEWITNKVKEMKDES